MKRTSKKRRPPRLTLRRAMRATRRFPLVLLTDVFEEPIVWLAIAAGLLYRFGFPTIPSLFR